ncbi:nitrate reductase molybdenum cofactor assembly chaperone [Uliginosibacterium sp. sgz301328]|uniref:nitrate reductase molybdenum cofactor assembly chaperone n=1 Tax=Uliginosibacterium sp. sgz301328 TaxID=3243764 RepID=UPI00359EE4ED
MITRPHFAATDHALPLRALAALLGYPQADLQAAASEIGDVLRDCRALSDDDRSRLAPLLRHLAQDDLIDLQEAYVELFDRGRRTSLHLFEHLHGESRDRGAAMIDLLQTYETAGFLLREGELPDYLPALLEFCGCVDHATARDFIADCAHLIRPLGEAVMARRPDYAAVFECVLHIGRQKGLDWTRAPEPDEEDIDREWQEQPAFNRNAEPGTEGIPITFMPRDERARGAKESKHG